MTHPYHPRFGQEFELVIHRHTWGEDRVFFYNEQGLLISMPAAWTSVVAPDPAVVIAQGRSHFRVVDLMGLADLIERLKCATPVETRAKECKANSVAAVK